MNPEELMALPPYSLPRGEKAALYRRELAALTRRHRERCPEYRRLLDALGTEVREELAAEDAPMLPVSLFKEMELRSVPEEEVFKTVTSSGTTGARVSRVYLDGETAAMQQRALYQIGASFIGDKRQPFLVLDSKNVLRDRAMFSARGAGVLGFSMFASKTRYALDGDMELDLEAVRRFLDGRRGERVLLFGFTYIIWKHVVRALEERGERLELPGSVLIHGGGWKKLAGEAVSREEFKGRVRRALGVEAVLDYYGMAEQTGGVYMECPCGRLHASVWSDVIIRRPRDYKVCAVGEPGVIESLSLLPRSYPGHAVLTEDMGVLLGEDDCPCGRLGKYFMVTGRVPRAEVRGCSDTYEG